MKENIPLLKVSAPGRICLFGEHQDYLGLPVIAAGISKRIAVAGNYRHDNQVVIHMPDIDDCEKFTLAWPLPYRKSRDYFRSTLNILQREGFRFSRGLEVTVHGNIPINSGTSSSSALIVAWINFLLQVADEPVPKSAQQIGEVAYAAEVLEFGEPGGMMDHYSTALGNIIYLESEPIIRIQHFMPRLGTFVLGDSLEPKDTLGILKRVKYGMLEAIKKIKQYHPDFNLHTAPPASGSNYRAILSADELKLLASNISDRDILRSAHLLLVVSLRTGISRVQQQQYFGATGLPGMVY